jgi:hypothetical protein
MSRRRARVDRATDVGERELDSRPERELEAIVPSRRAEDRQEGVEVMVLLAVLCIEHSR